MKPQLTNPIFYVTLFAISCFFWAPVQGDTTLKLDSSNLQNTPSPQRLKTKHRIHYPTMSQILHHSWIQTGLSFNDNHVGNSLIWSVPFQFCEITKQRKTKLKSQFKFQNLGIELVSTNNQITSSNFILPSYQIRWVRSKGWLYQFSANAGFARSKSLIPSFQLVGGSYQNSKVAYNYFCTKAAIGIGHNLTIRKNFHVYPYVEMGSYLQMPYNNFIYRGNYFHLGLNFPISGRRGGIPLNL